METWDEKLTNLLARKRVTKLKTHPKISSGIIGAILLFVFTPISSAIASDTELSILEKIFIAFIPIIIALIVWIIFSCVKKRLIWGELFEIYSNERLEDIINETISENEPSVKEFKGWMSDLSNDLQKKLIIVFDNMDRLPAVKVKELWSSIHTFFSENGYPNIWVIITFDYEHLANAFENEESNSDLTRHFIKKTFPVIYRVAPPIFTDWKKIFNEFYEDAFDKKEEENKEIIQRIFGIIQPHFTPRDIIAFINELVSLKQTWGDDIPLLPIAVFILLKEKILESPIESILSGAYLQPIEKLIINSDKLQGFIAALTYGIDVKLAEQIPLMQYLQNTLKGDLNHDINKYSDNKKFVQILDDTIKNIDPSLLDYACSSLSNFDTGKSIKITNQWHELVKLQLMQPIDTFSFNETHKALLLNGSDENKIKILKHLCTNYRNIKDFKGALYFSTLQAVDKFIGENKIALTLTEYIKAKKTSPEIFIDYLSEAKEDYLKYELQCDNKSLNDYLISLTPKSLPPMDFIKVLDTDDSYSFENLIIKIESTIDGNEIDATNFPEIIKAYKILSTQKPLKHQFNTTQIQNIISTTSDKSSDAYYDLVAMELSNQLINTPYVAELDEKVAERIEFYKVYGTLLVSAVNWGSDLLRKAVKKLTSKSYGPSTMKIEEVLPLFDKIITSLNIGEEQLLIRLDGWSKYAKEKVDINNIQSLIPNFNFYKNSCATKNELTKHINRVAISKLKTIPVDELYAQRNTPDYYWHNCASILFQNNILASMPDNFTEFCKKILLDISEQKQAIPAQNSTQDIFINKVDKRKLQATIKTICDEYCNKPNSITPVLFMFFASKFDFVNKMNSREGDISRNILNAVITDKSSLDYILENPDGYIKIINMAGEDAEDLKAKFQTIRQSDQSESLNTFLNAIGLEKEPEESEGE